MTRIYKPRPPEQQARNNAYRKAWYEANRERRAATNKAWYEANRERAIATNKTWYEANRERKLADFKAWREANPGYGKAWREANPGYDAAYGEANQERIAANEKAWREANPEAGRKKQANRRARRRAAFVESVDHDAVFVRDGGVCQICDTFIGDQKWHIDHRIPLAKGGEHSYANCQLAHATCNQKKHAKVPA